MDQTERAELLKLSHSLERFNNPCQSCHQLGAIGLKVHFKANAAFFFVRYESHTEGDLCGPCIHKTFIGYTITNLLLGWWGIVSMVKTPGFILWNCGEYTDALRAMWRRRKARHARVDEFLRKNGGC